ncbi:jg20436 [Pararge aegeria aegeria]|uniref:Jg20436 protein n=1 Tax=Pararge aegeria aegeria TaxID=348720 RepID=A0A8S4RVE7_9NEOP|nr:jg20436 [Pararge aegeria aegeria]
MFYTIDRGGNKPCILRDVTDETLIQNFTDILDEAQSFIVGAGYVRASFEALAYVLRTRLGRTVSHEQQDTQSTSAQCLRWRRRCPRRGLTPRIRKRVN